MSRGEEKGSLQWVDYGTYVQWAMDYGIKIKGVAPARIPGTGNGLFATRSIKAGEELVQVPATALLSIESVPKLLRSCLAGGKTHGILAAFLTLGEGTEHYAAWFRTFPTKVDLDACMPLMWPFLADEGGYTATLLPRAVTSLLAEQRARLLADFHHARSSYPTISFEAYRYYWLLVNTRTFYYDLLTKEKPNSQDDCMILCPFADYFNHADHGCNVTYNAEGFSIKADKDYDEGIELLVSYGSHTNDFLLVEYGFILEENRWDNLPIDGLLLGLTHDEPTRTILQDSNYLGAYTLNSNGVCHRTQVAIRAKTMAFERWQVFVDGLLEDEADDKATNQEIEQRILQPHYQEGLFALKQIEDTIEVPDPVKATLKQRWNQIIHVVLSAQKMMQERA